MKSKTEEEKVAIQRIAEKMVEALNSAGLKAMVAVIYRDGDAVVSIKTNAVRPISIYIGTKPKFDDFKYKYNLRTDMGIAKGSWVVDDGISRYFAPMTEWKRLVKQLINLHK